MKNIITGFLLRKNNNQVHSPKSRTYLGAYMNYLITVDYQERERRPLIFVMVYFINSAEALTLNVIIGLIQL
jgi:hypothetical protein